MKICCSKLWTVGYGSQDKIGLNRHHNTKLIDVYVVYNSLDKQFQTDCRIPPWKKQILQILINSWSVLIGHSSDSVTQVKLVPRSIFYNFEIVSFFFPGKHWIELEMWVIMRVTAYARYTSGKKEFSLIYFSATHTPMIQCQSE